MALSRPLLDLLLFDWLALPAHLPAHLDRDSVAAMLDAATRLADRHLAPHAAKSDANEPYLVDGRVVLIPEIGAALQAYRQTGLFAMHAPLETGGLALPHTVASAIGALLTAANPGTNGYAFLTQAAANLLRLFGSDEQRSRYLPKMEAGEWFGTMCLSEPHAGSSVGDIRTLATPRADGTYSLRGSKMWISGGEHELAENIVHLVLAKIPGGPPGSKGVSLFVVPRFRDGRSNGVSLAGLNHKMGYRGTVNCLLDFGGEECVGELIGAPHEGLRQMFRMMNEARVGVGIGAAAIGCAGFEEALHYARERTQGRLPSQRDTSAPMQPLVAHADVRRMLLKAQSQAQGALALCLYAARLVDEAGRGDADAQRLLDLLTPIAKAWPAEHALQANDLAIQVLGGAGYTRDFPLERMYRDNRLNPIHEGTNGIQALDLLGRKVLGDGGRALALLVSRIEATLRRAQSRPDWTATTRELASMLPDVQAAVQTVSTLASAHIDLALANASLFLDALGHVVVAWLWLDIALLPSADAGLKRAARYFIECELPSRRHALKLVARADRIAFDASF